MTFSPNADTVYADGPTIEPYQPKKSDIRALLAQYEYAISAIASGAGTIAKDTRANLFADLAHEADTMAWVYADAQAAYNGIYRKIGASGSGYWFLILPLPYSFIIASDVGNGTPNAIQATTSVPVNESALVLANIFRTNTSSPVTISFNGAPDLTIKTSSLNDVDPGGLIGGGVVWGIKRGMTFQLANDEAIANVVRGYMEQAQAEADAAAASAINAQNSATQAQVEAGNAAQSATDAAALVAAAEAGFTGFPSTAAYDFGSVTESTTYFNQNWGTLP